MKKSARNRKRKKYLGFTIIELMIVLAIVGLIILIVLLAAPAVMRTQRNNDRKQAVNYVESQIREFYNTHGHFPLRTSGAQCATTPECTQLEHELENEGPSKLFDVNIVANNTPHEFPFHLGDSEIPDGSYDMVVVFPAHRCNYTPGLKPGDSQYPVFAYGGGDNDFRRFVVYAVLEPQGSIYCVDDTKNGAP